MRGLAMIAAGVLGARAAVDTLRAIVEYDYHESFLEGPAGAQALPSVLARLDTLEEAGLALMLVAAASFVAWMTVRYRALPQRFRPKSWAWAAWLVPAVNLVEPYLILCEIWAGGPEGRHPRAPWLVFTWWCCALAHVTCLLAILAAEARAGTLLRDGDRESAFAQAVLSGRLAIAAAVLSALAATLAAAMVILVERRRAP